MPTQFRNVTPQMLRHLVVTNTVVQYEWFTGWMSCDGVDNIRAVLKCKNATDNNFNWQLAIQYAAVRADNPGAPGTLGANQTSSGEYQTGDVSVATNMGSNRLFRLGIAYSSSAAAQKQGDVYLQASWKQVGTDLGTRRVTLALSDSSNRYVPLTGWIPATFMAKVKAAFVLTSITPSNGNFKYRLAYQTAGTMVEQAGAWNDIENAFTQPANGVSYDEHNTGEIALTVTDMWFRLGVAYTQAGGVDANYSAVLDAACACR